MERTRTPVTAINKPVLVHKSIRDTGPKGARVFDGYAIAPLLERPMLRTFALPA
jgi:hypothetical protein